MQSRCPPRQHEPHLRRFGQHDADGIDELPDSLAVHEPAGKEHDRRCAIRPTGEAQARDIVNAVADNADAVIDPRAVVHQQAALGPGETNNAVRAVDDRLLLRPLPYTLRRSGAEFVFGTIE